MTTYATLPVAEVVTPSMCHVLFRLGPADPQNICGNYSAATAVT
jgi:hypothetical protein